MTKNCRTNTLSPAFTLPRQIFSEMTKHGRMGEWEKEVGGGGDDRRAVKVRIITHNRLWPLGYN